MLGENIKALRENKGMTQDFLAEKLNVVRQTVSKWEKGLSVPDAYMLIKIAEVFDVPVSSILGEEIKNTEKDDEIKILSLKLEEVNKKLSDEIKKKQKKRKIIFSIMAVLAGCDLIHVLYKFVKHQKVMGVIGGADGPTAVVIASAGTNNALVILNIIIAAIVLITALILLLKQRKK